jgi:hypothetical protein
MILVFNQEIQNCSITSEKLLCWQLLSEYQINRKCFRFLLDYKQALLFQLLWAVTLSVLVRAVQGGVGLWFNYAHQFGAETHS